MLWDKSGVLKRFLLVVAVTLPFYSSLYAKKEGKSSLVRVVKPYESKTNPTIQITGSAYFSISSGVAAEMGGKIKKIFVDEGNKVVKDSPLVQLDDEMISYSLDIAKVATKVAKSNLDQAKNDYERNKALYKTKAVALSIFEDFETNYINAQNEYEKAKVNESMFATQKDKFLIKSPINGVVTTKDVEVGEWVDVGGLVLNIGSNSYEARIGVPERILPYIKVGDRIVLESLQKNYDGKILSINKKGDLLTRTFEVRISLGDDKSLNEGTILKAFMPTNKEVEALFLPRDVVVTRNSQQGIFLEKDGKAIFEKVKIIGYRGKDIGIVGNFTKDDNIILDGNGSIENGSSVVIKQ